MNSGSKEWQLGDYGSKISRRDFSCSGPALSGDRETLAMFLARIVTGWLHENLLREEFYTFYPFADLFSMDELTFTQLRAANLARLPQFKNGKGELAHSKADGSDWSLAQWCNAVTGELGETANIIKKIDRGDITLDEARNSLADEIADIQTYLDILAYQAKINLGMATRRKWNAVSERIGSDLRL